MIAGLNKRISTCAWPCAGLIAALCGLSFAAFGHARPARPETVARKAPATTALTLEQAVAKVQHDTHGKVLRAGTRQYGNMTEYLIKVLTPDGRVRVVPVRSRPVHTSRKAQKETH